MQTLEKPEVQKCTEEEYEVLAHTSRTGRYVTGEKAVIAMGEAGLLRDHGAQRLAGGDHYFTMTGEGRAALDAYRESLPKPPPLKKLTKSKRRYQEYLTQDSGLSFREWLVWKEHDRRTKFGLAAAY